MSLHIVLAVSALAASIVLVLSLPSRALALVALLASGVEVAMALGLVHLSVAHLPLGIVLGLSAALVYSFYIVGGARIMREVDPLVASATVCAAAHPDGWR